MKVIRQLERTGIVNKVLLPAEPYRELETEWNSEKVNNLLCV